MDMGLGRALFAVDLDDEEDNREEWELISVKDIPPENITYLGEYGPNEKP